jgi:hypothetical protein
MKKFTAKITGEKEILKFDSLKEMAEYCREHHSVTTLEDEESDQTDYVESPAILSSNRQVYGYYLIPVDEVDYHLAELAVSSSVEHNVFRDDDLHSEICRLFFEKDRLEAEISGLDRDLKGNLDEDDREYILEEIQEKKQEIIENTKNFFGSKYHQRQIEEYNRHIEALCKHQDCFKKIEPTMTIEEVLETTNENENNV